MCLNNPKSLKKFQENLQPQMLELQKLQNWESLFLKNLKSIAALSVMVVPSS